MARKKLLVKSESKKLFEKLEKNWQEEKQTILENQAKTEELHQEQLRKINLSFDDNAKNYETIDFNGLYSLLENIKAERERERAR